MNTDFRVSVDFFNHHKTIKLKKRIGDAGVLCLLRLWAYVAKVRPGGDIGGMTEEDIEISAGWEGGDGTFVRATVECGYLDSDENGYSIHDWREHNPWAADAESRSDTGRLNRMKHTHPDMYELLIQLDYTNISREEYLALTKENYKQSLSTLKNRLKQRLAFAQAQSPSPAPSPAPVPDPVPEPRALKVHVRSEDVDTASQGRGKKAKPEYTPEFKRFWDIYPRQIRQPDAFAAWRNRLAEGILDVDAIVAATEAYAKAVKYLERPPDKVMHPTTFINGERWRAWLPPHGAEYLDAVETYKQRHRSRGNFVPASGFSNVYAQAAARDPDEIIAEMLGDSVTASPGMVDVEAIVHNDTLELQEVTGSG